MNTKIKTKNNIFDLKFNHINTAFVINFTKPLCLLAVFSLICAPVAPVFADEIIKSNLSTINEQSSIKSIINSNEEYTSETTSNLLTTKTSATSRTLEEVSVQDSNNEINLKDGINSEALPLQDSILHGSSNNLSAPIQQTSNAQIGFDGSHPTPPPGISQATMKMSPRIDEGTGALTNNYKFDIPAGRNGLTPDLSLLYNSQNLDNQSYVGYGWEFSIPYISRVNKHGTNKLYSGSDPNFISSTGGELIQISQTSGEYGTYASKNEKGDFLTYTFNNQSWIVKDKKGVTFKFGISSDERQDDPQNNTHIYKWMLTEIRDTNNNFISYTYSKNQGQIYPYDITYTGHNTTAGIYKIQFVRATNGGNIYSYSSYTPAFKVTTAFSISQVQVLVNNSIIKSFTLSYSPARTVLTRQLLSSIQENYQSNGQQITLPPEIFTYQTESATGFGTNGNMPITIPVDTHTGVQAVDVNSDSYPDIVRAYDFVTNGYSTLRDVSVYLPQTNNWQINSSWVVPPYISFYVDTLWDDNSGFTKIVDVNADMKPDLLRIPPNGSSDPHDYEINNGTGWSYNGIWNPNMMGYSSADLNGDSLPDYIEDINPATNYNCGCLFYNTNVSLNNGSGFDIFQYSWHYPTAPTHLFDTPDYLGGDNTLVDVNGDGLTDIVKSRDTQGGSPYDIYTQKVFINTGTTWVYDQSWTIPSDVVIAYQNGGNLYQQPIYFMDLNNDGFVDIVIPFSEIVGNNTITNIHSYINNGHGWTRDTNWNSLVQLVVQNQNNPKLVGDMDANGTLDFFSSYGSTADVVYNNNNNQVDLLSGVTISTGGQVNITYKASSKYRDDQNNLFNPQLPIIIQTVESITTIDSVAGIPSTTHYTYEGGKYFYGDVFNRKFSGFNVVTSIDPAGNFTKTYYHQGDVSDTFHGEFNDQYSKIGKSYRTENFDSTGNLYSKTINKWDNFNIGANHDFVKLAQTVNYSYDGNGTHRDTAEIYNYDNTNGNILSKVELGEVIGSDDGTFVDVNNDTRTTNYSYAFNTSNILTGNISEINILDSVGNQIANEKIYYDNLPINHVSVGNQTSDSKLVSGNIYSTSYKTYDSYGFTTSSTDLLGNVTTYLPDAYELYPESITNALGQTTTYQYNYSVGKVSQMTNVNGFVSTTTYDTLGRILQENVPDPQTGVLVTRTKYIYNDIPNNVSINKITYRDQTNVINSYQYLDSLGRVIQERNQADASGNFNTIDTKYNNQGLMSSQSVPYSSTGTARTISSTTSSYFTNYTYDALGRVKLASNSIGSINYGYDDWKSIVTDQNQHIKENVLNSYGNLVSVIEHNQGQTYITNYVWNLAGNLISMTDSMGNIRYFTYDNLGERLTETDLHSPTDTTFGQYAYTYDLAGNLIKSVDPRGKVVTYTYDNLNRPLGEYLLTVVNSGPISSSSQTPTLTTTQTNVLQISYVYDNCQNGVGKLCIASRINANTTNYKYDAAGNNTDEDVLIGSVHYITARVYNLLGDVKNLTYPDNSKTYYWHDAVGRISSVSFTDTQNVSHPIISGILYNPINLPTVTTFGNGVVATNTYDQLHQYRLTHKVTTNQFNSHLQDLSYTYDPVGNITTIIDASNTTSAKTINYTYDDLNRLLSATATNTANNQNFTQNYTYDSLGNILSGPIGTYLYTGNTASLYANPHAATNINGIKYSYDIAGNLVNVGGTTMYSWTYRGELASIRQRPLINTSSSQVLGTLVTAPLMQPAQLYVYDNASNRISETTDGVTTYYPNKNFETKGTTTTDYIYGKLPANGDILLATASNNGTTTNVVFNHSDQVNSSSIILDSLGNASQNLDYYPYGEVRLNNQSGNI